MPVIRVLKKENTRVLSLLMLYENRKIIIFKVLSSIFYCITEKYVCVYYLCCMKTKLHVTGRGQGSESIRYFSVSGIFIPEILMNIISCHGFVNNTKSDVKLSCRRKLVSYYISKGFMIL